MRNHEETLKKTEAFCRLYGIENAELFHQLYEVDELTLFLPPQPTEQEKNALQELTGTLGVEGYMDYVKSNHTFELIMQWREKTGNWD